MKRSEAAEGLMMYGKTGPSLTKTEWKLLDDLVKDGFAASTNFGITATAATPLALLTPTQLLCAQQLAEAGEIGFNSVPKAQKAHMEKLVENGWAGWRSSQPPAQFVGRVWVPTPKLIETIECLRKAKGGLK